ncbi:Tn3 family transposase [Arenibacter latericius]|uniref:Tn3 family transposase n=1 Tax=Arenibacter latericius TaxID=86104 RepID=UPI000402363E|nr:Tn3 family transposase [Arenibacter latericius]
MKRNWTADEILEYFTILEKEMVLVSGFKNTGKLGFLVILKFFQIEAKFPVSKEEIPYALIQFIAKQLHSPLQDFDDYPLDGRTFKRHKNLIREHFGFRISTIETYKEVALSLKMLDKWHDKKKIRAEAIGLYRKLKVELPSSNRLDKLVDSVVNAGEQQFFAEIGKRLSLGTKERMDVFVESITDTGDDSPTMSLNSIRSDPGRIGLESIFGEMDKLIAIRYLKIPDNLFASTPFGIIEKYRLRVASELLGEIRAHPDDIRHTLLSIFFWTRSREITDNLVELLIQVVHKISNNAEQKVVKEFVKDFKKVSGKYNILLKMAENSLRNPDGTVRDVIYPVAKEETLRDLVKELKRNRNAFKGSVFTKILASYSRHYRKMLPDMLEILDFKSNNAVHRPVIEALEILREHMGTKVKYLEIDGSVPINGIIKPGQRKAMIQKDGNGNRIIKKMEYEICVLQTLREKLRCKEVWVDGADRYRNPEEDLPQDFEEKRSEYYTSLNRPEDPRPFVDGLKSEMKKWLFKLNTSVSQDPDVRISSTKGGRISLTPFERQSESKNIERLKEELFHNWPMISLLDILKETDLRIHFTDVLQSSAEREIIEKYTRRKRLLMVLFAMGTNTGLKRISGSIGNQVTYDNLRYIKRKYINKDNLRNANIEVVNAIHSARLGNIWGEGTTSCASDSKKFGAWDQNLMTEWHIRYRGRGVMIYWHVEKKSSCIYSQLKSCSSSEVAAMIEGVLKHCTSMDIDRNYVDTHGQSEVAFAFSHLLDFSLMPRFKSLSSKKLYLPNKSIKKDLPNLLPVLTRGIDWSLIGEQYDQMIKYTTALKLGTAKAEAILKRFTRNNLQHPTYKALQELGKVVKTIFLCEYLTSKPLRMEINQGLNVVENWNSANSFIFYGKSGEMSTNNLEDQELSVLCLHLLQNSLVYVNTLMIQEILTKQKWNKLLEPEDLRALTPLIYKHINPYGRFELDMEKRIPLNYSS